MTIIITISVITTVHGNSGCDISSGDRRNSNEKSILGGGNNGDREY